jgi:hypothetical protein
VLSLADGVLAWRGAALAALYDVRVSAATAGGPWLSACACATGCDVLCLADDASPLKLNATLVPAGAWVLIGSFAADGSPGAWAQPAHML